MATPAACDVGRVLARGASVVNGRKLVYGSGWYGTLQCWWLIVVGLALTGSQSLSRRELPEPVLVSRLLEPSSGVVGSFKHLHVAAQSPVAGAAPLLGDVFWDQSLSLEKLKDLLPSPVSVPATVPVVAASIPSSVLDQQCNVEESGDVSWPQDRWEWYRARLSVPPWSRSQSVFSAYCCWSFRLCFFLASSPVFTCYAFRHVRFQAHEGLSASVQWYLPPA